MQLAGCVALVTGAGIRVGRSIALALAGRGMRVAVHYNSSLEGARTTVSQIERNGGEAWAIRSDLSRSEAPAGLVEDVAMHFGSLDVLVNSAAIMLETPGQVSTEAWDQMFAINLRAPFFCAQAAASVMASRGGVIVNIADLAGLETWPTYVPFGITKAGVIQMTRALARTLGPAIRVNAVAPGAVLLPEKTSAADAERLVRGTPLKRLGSPEDVAQAVIFLLEADYVTGETLIVDGGRHVR
ncbi:MAG: SDR family oxidoreductase [Gemmatimonadaceae bacterium]